MVLPLSSRTQFDSQGSFSQVDGKHRDGTSFGVQRGEGGTVITVPPRPGIVLSLVKGISWDLLGL